MSQRFLLGVLAVVLCAGAGACFGRVITVNWDGSGDYTTIQAAIDRSSNRDEIIIADGTYTGDGNRDIDFTGKKITVRSENGPEVCIVDCEGEPNEPHRGFIFHNEEDDRSVLEGVTVTGGYVVGGSGGGGIYCYRSSPSIINCVITGNFVEKDDGGGLNLFNCNAQVIDCVISNNYAKASFWWDDYYNMWYSYYGNGGGIWSYGSSLIQNCVITGNRTRSGELDFGNPQSSGRGGGIYISGGSIIDCIIEDNYCDGGNGGGGIFASSTTDIIGCTINNNSVFYTVGGGIIGGGTITDCTITGNSGGGLRYCDGMISNCIITGNTGCGLISCDGSIINCDIGNNTAGRGGGLNDCNGTISNCTITNNSALGTYGHGGGFYDCDAAEISNCTIADNVASYKGGGIFSSYGNEIINNCIIWGNSPDEIDIYNGNPVITYSDIEGGWEGEGNIDVDPEFVDAPGGDYHLMWDSPCVDAGDPNFVAQEGEVDIDGEPRVMGGRVDMGADEVDDRRTIKVALDASGDYMTIQDGIDAAEDGDTVIVADGIYTGDGNRDIDFKGKAITVRSAMGADNCIIDCQGSQTDEHRGFVFENGETNASVLKGFTIKHGYMKHGGGGILCYESDPVITNCIIIDNTSDYAGGILCNISNAEIRNCVISQNNATVDGVAGGIMCISSSNVEITGCTISSNTNSELLQTAAVEVVFYSRAVLRNCIVWSNISGYPLLVWPESELGVWYSDIEGGQAGVWVDSGDSLIWGQGNIDVYPSFVDTDRADYHLRWNSPCIEAGDPDFSPEEGEVDIDGEPRVMVLGIEMGADEIGFRQADFTRDGRIDVSDLAVLSGAWETQEGELRWYVLSDLFEDGVIGLGDLAMFVDDWLWVAEWAN
jgi:hypothetical protein